jgi:hypothetical protein
MRVDPNTYQGVEYPIEDPVKGAVKRHVEIRQDDVGEF